MLSDGKTESWFRERLLPFQCHKVVHAVKVFALMCDEEHGWSLLIDDPEGKRCSIGVQDAWMAKHDPKPGGYYVRYEDGYSSWSPAKAFEAGYEQMEYGVGEDPVVNDIESAVAEVLADEAKA